MQEPRDDLRLSKRMLGTLIAFSGGISCIVFGLIATQYEIPDPILYIFIPAFIIESVVGIFIALKG